MGQASGTWSNQRTLAFAYHADGLRREKTDGVTTTRYHYDGQSLFAVAKCLSEGRSGDLFRPSLGLQSANSQTIFSQEEMTKRDAMFAGAGYSIGEGILSGFIVAGQGYSGSLGDVAAQKLGLPSPYVEKRGQSALNAIAHPINSFQESIAGPLGDAYNANLRNDKLEAAFHEGRAIGNFANTVLGARGLLSLGKSAITGVANARALSVETANGTAALQIERKIALNPENDFGPLNRPAKANPSSIKVANIEDVLTSSEIDGLSAIGLQRGQMQELLSATNGDLYVFRGTRSNAATAGGESSELIGITPVTIDPLRATIFALGREGTDGVPGSVFFGSKTELSMEITRGNTPFGAPTTPLLQLEMEMGASVTPSIFAQRAPYSISAKSSVEILNDMGLGVQSSVTGNLSNVLRQYPPMTPAQIGEYIQRASEVR